ncbi:LysR family transcriptional regulator [Nevskia sp.]|uniref:winged helix-turn-helix domain-containing protein n=1 Tax=Nevskia sp. TaxID=1929292 RepID=UPI0025FF8A6E|nr:LysR family transcriptional regulator [Nevskia sp.]
MSLRHTVRIRWHLDDAIAFGPGKAELLAAIRDCGSISSAARKLDMSYRRAWLLVETMNRCFDPPLVASATGGSGGGGAKLTEAGLAVLAAFDQLQANVAAVIEAGQPSFEQHVRKTLAD